VSDLETKIDLRFPFDIHRRKSGLGTCQSTPAQIYTAMEMTDNSHLVLLPLAPLLFALYLHLISQASLPSPPSMPGATAKPNTTPQHAEYYIKGADLIVRVRGFRSESCRYLRQKAHRWRTYCSESIAIFSYAIRHFFATNFRIHRRLEIHKRARRTATL
jgi:hypothetical protein